MPLNAPPGAVANLDAILRKQAFINSINAMGDSYSDTEDQRGFGQGERVRRHARELKESESPVNTHQFVCLPQRFCD